MCKSHKANGAKGATKIADHKRPQALASDEVPMGPRLPKRKQPRPWLLLSFWNSPWSKRWKRGWIVAGRYRTEKARDQALKHHQSQGYKFCQYKAAKEGENDST